MIEKTRMRVAVLFGGRSVEHEVSLRSGRTVLEALDPARFEAIPVGITRDGRWRAGKAAECLLEGKDTRPEEPGEFVLAPDPGFHGLAGPGSDGAWRRTPVDVVFPLVHGMHGEDGTLQGLLDLAEIPYVGSGVAASALGMDKLLQRHLFRAVGLPVLPTLPVARHLWETKRDAQIDRILGEIGLPCFIKPAGCGSSVGVGKARHEADLPALIEEAARYDTVILAEPAVDARELECAVLGNQDPEVTRPGEIIPQREFYDYRAKYLEDTTELRVPAPLEPETVAEMRRLAGEAFRHLGCAGLARIDFFLERGSGKIWINEVNTLPGFTSISMYPRLWALEGVDLRTLVGRLVDLAGERHAERSRTRWVLPDSAR